MKSWKMIPKEEFPLFSQPVLWLGGDFKGVTSEISTPNVEVTLQVRNLKEKSFSHKLVYDVHEIFCIQLEVKNISGEGVSHILVSHMIRDHFAYVPSTLQANKGRGEFLFQLVRWRIDTLLPNEKVQLICQLKVIRIPIPSSIPLRATYTFKHKDLVYGPFQTKDVILIKK
ncbi:hypothetical protein QUF99_21040 [Bacillus sp. DX4.1]|uniref:hypothetical protein n=1 Tax=Bacillus sp. DX4.1 TaxID=3055867 RepID=UPI0025A0D15A|nr:hypothetical protein [Bacillus sp. DX4.1]MDM5189710.1 hypothetical protein [Bacillus sp. DX4.1]